VEKKIRTKVRNKNPSEKKLKSMIVELEFF
jgi:hypothetical protein